MEGFQLDEIMELELTSKPKSSRKQIKRRWREIEEMNDKRRLQKELMDIDESFEYKLTDINF